jgi:hypothetical protein
MRLPTIRPAFGLKAAQIKTPAENLPASCFLIASFLPGQSCPQTVEGQE